MKAKTFKKMEVPMIETPWHKDVNTNVKTTVSGTAAKSNMSIPENSGFTKCSINNVTIAVTRKANAGITSTLCDERFSFIIAFKSLIALPKK